MKKNKKQLKGFTLIEIVITVAIVSIVSSVLFVNYNSNRLQKDVDMSGREVVSALREAQNYALTGGQTVWNSDPCRFQMIWGATGYSTVYWYKDGAGACTRQTTIRSYTLKNGVTFSNASNFYFSLPHASVSFGGPSIGATVTKGGYTNTACVYRDGLITNVSGSTCP